MRGPVLAHLVGEQGGVNAAEYHKRAARSGGSSDLIPAQRISSMDADSDDISNLNGVLVDRLERLVDEQRRAMTCGGRSGENVHPPWGDHGGAKRHIARIDEMNAHASL
jgi:hypothetical protein